MTAEIARLRHDNVALTKAYNAVRTRCDSLAATSGSRAEARQSIAAGGVKHADPAVERTLFAPAMTPPHVQHRSVSAVSANTSLREREQLQTARNESDNLRQLLIAREEENGVLRAQLHAAVARGSKLRHEAASANQSRLMAPPAWSPPGKPEHDYQHPHSALDHRSVSELLRLTRSIGAVQSAASAAALDRLSSVLGVLLKHGVVTHQPSSDEHCSTGGDPGDIIAAATIALDELTRQVCDRERAYERAVRRSSLVDLMTTINLSQATHSARSPQRSGPLSTDRTARVGSLTPPATETVASAEQQARASALTAELRAAPLLGWQQWRQVLGAMPAPHGTAGHSSRNQHASRHRFDPRQRVGLPPLVVVRPALRAVDRLRRPQSVTNGERFDSRGGNHLAAISARRAAVRVPLAAFDSTAASLDSTRCFRCTPLSPPPAATLRCVSRRAV
jgi:hypothetical protein